MSNIINSNFSNLHLKLNTDEYWDFFICKDVVGANSHNHNGDQLDDNCLISYIDTSNFKCVDGTDLKSIYTWNEAYVTNHTMMNIGVCGIDNGTVPFRRDKENNRSFVDILTNSRKDITSEENYLRLHQVSGGTTLYDYPIELDEQEGLARLNGGFYQGFFETTCDKYKVLPSVLGNGDTWHFEFTLKKEEFEAESNKTLNDKHPSNKGIFFYIGTRSENKFVYSYNDDDECFTLGEDDYVENGEIKKEEHIIKELVNANPPMPIFCDEYAIFNYVEDKYYPPKNYTNDSVSIDDVAFEEYISEAFKPIVIDETIAKPTFIGGCCCYKNADEEIIKQFYNDDHNFLLTQNDMPNYAACDMFGDDYLLDVGDINDLTDFIEIDLDLTNFQYENEGGISLTKYQKVIDTDNKFLLFDRTCDGYNVHNWEEGTIGRYLQTKSSFNGNLFLLMNRTCTGYTVYNIDQLRDTYKKEYNVYNDLYNNALAFRITDSGAIGYRYLTTDCENEDSDYKIEEGYSYDGIIKENEWTTINVKLSAMMSKMQLRFYVNGRLVYISKDLPKLNLRSLNEEQEKQEGVPYNLSLGGGTQGLADTIIIYNYMLGPYRVYPLEKHFGGSFIGWLKTFKFFNCSQEFLTIQNNFKYEQKTMEEF